ncbi:MAG: hypothetical protein K2L16_07180 [Muribaculaceae bacterium]|nr:hypothetical protein [Muribaculaceae bacterium]
MTPIIIGAVILALIVGGLVFYAIRASRAANAAQQANEQLLIDMAQRDLEREYGELNDEFAAFENQRRLVVDDSVRRELNDKYEAARIQVERLQQELNDSERRSAAEISRLRAEIETLRNLLRHYVEEIDRLNQENQALRTENQQIREQNERLSSRVNETTRQNEVLSERMTLAERLNVTGLTLTPLNKKGKKEKKVNKAKQLVITFTIPQNNSTPVGEKTIYARIVSPSGQLLGPGGSFSFEGGNVECTAQKTIEYAGEEIGGITIYYDVNTPLIAGDYTVELFADNFRLISRNFTLQ